ncbi:MAG: sulfotransferase domain-containing protein [Pseudomonadota bacterium]
MVGFTRRLERHFPGIRKRKQYWTQRRRLKHCDIVIVAQAKSGRTWLNVMLSHVTHQIYGVGEHLLIGDRRVEHRYPKIPRVLFTHDNARLWGRPLGSSEDYRHKKVVLLVRDPRDVAVSLYFHRNRKLADPSRRSKPHHQSIFERVRKRNLPQATAFLERWVQNIENLDHVFVLRYEDLRLHPENELSRLLEFLGIDAGDECVRRAVAFADFDNMRNLEREGRVASGKLRTFDPTNPNAFKVRRGKVGGYRDYFGVEEISALDAVVARAQLQAFGYGAMTTNRVCAGREIA